MATGVETTLQKRHARVVRTSSARYDGRMDMKPRLPHLACVVALLLVGCSADQQTSGGLQPDAGDVAAPDAANAPDAGVDAAPSWDVPADRSILEFTANAGASANQAALPTDWAGIDPARCARDTTRQFIGELVNHGINDPQVMYHWAPIVPGPNTARPLQGMFDFYLAGTVAGSAESGDDVRSDHPFGFDFTWNVEPDPAFAYMATDGGGDPGESEQGVHSEIEMPVFPRDLFGFDPTTGDRSLQTGAWVLDCGHPPYGAEMHPPTFLAFARATSATDADSIAFVNPYRIAQLYAPTADKVTSFDDPSRYGSAQPFPKFFVIDVLKALQGRVDRIEGHMMMDALRFDRLEWDVCAPLPRPSGASLDATWRFTERTGVTVKAFADDDNGCVHLVATMDDRYTPAPLTPTVVEWPWDELSASASSQYGQTVDVRQKLIDIAVSMGFSDAASNPALAADHPPRIDHYNPLVPRPGADKAAPTAIIDGADDQPFPFYGHVRVGWK